MDPKKYVKTPFLKKATFFGRQGIWVNWARSSSARPTYWSWWPNVKVKSTVKVVKVNRGRGLFLLGCFFSRCVRLCKVCKVCKVLWMVWVCFCWVVFFPYHPCTERYIYRSMKTNKQTTIHGSVNIPDQPHGWYGFVFGLGCFFLGV